MSDIFQEIDEELRRENFAKLWQRYGVYLVGLAVLIVVAVAAIVGWRAYQQRLHEAEGERYAVALDLARQGKDKEATEVFAEVSRQAHGGHAMLARFEEAALKSKDGDTKGAIALYDALSADSSLDPAYRDLARLMAAQGELKDGDPRAVITGLAPLTSPSNPWHPTALELTALAQLKAGGRAEARATYQRIADDLQAPQGLRARAAEILAWPSERKTEAAPPAAASPPGVAAPPDAAMPPAAAPAADTQGQR
ncbi:MAG TPA: tetratricopeptide repeat protein [Stellaceae bacterium]|nr:tetratricopeptide repeat protein [Stellaceae bacterium]